jgi:translocation and assembly module TamB
VRIKRFLIWSIAGIFGLALLAAAALYWASRSETMLRWGVGKIATSLPCLLSVEGMQGAFMEPVHVQYLVCENADFRVEAHNVALVWSPWLLTSRRLDVTSLHVDALTYRSKSDSSKPLQAPDDIRIPMAIDVTSVEIDTLVVQTRDSSVEINAVNAAYHGDMRTHRLALRNLETRWGRAAGEATIGASAPLPISAKVAIQSNRLEDWPLTAQIDVSGEMRRLTAALQASAGQLRVAGEIVLAPFDANPVISITARTSNVDVANFDPRLPHTALSATVQAQPVGTSALTGRLRGDNAEPGRLDQQRLPMQSLDANFALDMASLRLSDLRVDLGAAGKANGSAEIAKDHIALALDVRKLNLLAARGDLRQTSLNGLIRVDYRDDRQFVAVDLRQKDMQLEGDAEVTAQRILVKRMTARAGGAQLLASGSLGLDDNLTFTLDGLLKTFDPARFGDFPQASINGTLQARGQLRPEWQADVQYKLGRSQLTGIPIGGNGTLRVSPSRLTNADMQLDYGGNDLRLTGSFGASGDALAFSLDARRLDRLDKRATGRLQTSGTLTGTLKRPAVTADLRAQEIGFEQYGIADVAAKVSFEQDDQAAIRGQVKVQKFTRGGLTLDTVEAGIDGTLATHAVDLAVAAPDLQLKSRVEGGWDTSKRVWSGVVTSLENEGKYPVKMTRPATLELAQDRVLLGATEVQFSATELKLEETRFQNGSLVTKGTISGVRAARVLALMKKPPAVESTLVLGGRWEIRADKSVDGFVELARTDGDVVIPGDEPLALELKELRVTLRAVANQITGEAIVRSAQIDAQGSATTRLEKRGEKWGVPGTAFMNLEGNIQMQSIRPLAALANRAVTADGNLKLVIKGGGTVANPRLTGRVEGDKLKIEDVANGIFFHDGVLRASFGDDALTLTQLKLRGGQGELNAHGKFSARKSEPVMELQWAASRLQVIQHPDLRLRVSGAGQLQYKDALFSLKGELTADQGRVELRKRTMPSLGDDVVVTGRETRSQLATETKRANLDLKLDLGPDFTVVGRGLNARMAGQMRLTSAADKPLAAEGEIRVASGTYEAYGRRLQIDRGVLYFAGPVNNPGINIRAMRKKQPVEAGVEVTGTARDPRVRLVSDPEVSDPDKLAWLVLGRQAETSNTQDNKALQSSAMALAAGLGTTPFQRQLAQAVGLDEINFVPGDGQSQSGVVAVSKQISDKVYVTQEFGTTAAGNTLRVSYQLTRRWAVRTESGETDAVDLFFTLSFD